MTKIIFKPENIEGFDGFYWDADDIGAWWGPLNDWNSSHRNVIERILRRGLVLQAGGNCGLYPVLLSKYFNRVVTFEPDKSNYEILVKNVERHALNNVAKFNSALGETVRLAGLTKGPKDNVGMHRIDDGPGAQMVPMIAVDDIFANESVDFIWFDIELYELNALKGAVETIERNKPLVMIENRNHAIDVLMSDLGYIHLEDSKMDSIFGHKDVDYFSK